MSLKYESPLSINFIWNPFDDELAKPIIEEVSCSLSRDKEKPFSRSLNIPLFIYSSSNGNIAPKGQPISDSTITLIFVFTSENTVGNKPWLSYVNSLQVSETIKIVPIALNRFGLNHEGSLEGLNCIRAYDWPHANYVPFALVAISHEIYRHGLHSVDASKTGSSKSLKLFLSHSKVETKGRSFTKTVKEYIDETNMRRFFDATEIAPGFSFASEIEKHIEDSTLIAFETDSYSSRYWCQREILHAKESERPIIIVSCLSSIEDRIFPASSNVPRIVVPSSDELSETTVLKILAASLIETIRFQYSLKLLKQYKNAGWIDKNSALLGRPPEIRQMFELSRKSIKEACYPEPPIYSEESDWHSMVGVATRTPLWNSSDQDSLLNEKVGISISERNEDNFCAVHTHHDQLVRLSQDLARHLLASSATLVYGGDLRKDGFTQFILDEAAMLQERLKTVSINVENHLAWPLFIDSPEIRAWRAGKNKLMATVESPLPVDVGDGIPIDKFLPPDSTENSYVWSRSLTTMREQLVEDTSSRICVGGKASGFKGKMPGVLEEIILTLQMGKPLFLLGGFQGIVADVCEAILHKTIPSTLTEEWQVNNNAGYADLQVRAKKEGYHCDYANILQILHSTDISELAANSDLMEEEYIVLMNSRYADECTHLLLKGLRSIKKANLEIG
jgi:hypothetical protein